MMPFFKVRVGTRAELRTALAAAHTSPGEFQLSEVIAAAPTTSLTRFVAG
jgi:hypothetical protein